MAWKLQLHRCSLPYQVGKVPTLDWRGRLHKVAHSRESKWSMRLADSQVAGT